MLVAPLILSIFTHSEGSDPQDVDFPSLAEEKPDLEMLETKTPWEGSLTLGGSFTSGNNDNQSVAATFDATRRVYRDRYTAGFNFAWNETNGTTTQRRTEGVGNYNRFLDEKTYLLANLGANSDLAAGVDLRWSAGLGCGHQFVSKEKFEFAGEAGLSYLSQQFDLGPDSEYTAARLAYNVRWAPNKVWELTQFLRLFPSLEDSEDFYANADTRVRASINEALFGQFQWIYDYTRTPAPGKGSDDSLFLVTVGWKF